MDFKEATDGLFARMDHEDLAKRLGVSVASIRQARLKPEAGAHRSPPENWQPAVIRAAEERVWHYRKLIERLRDQGQEGETAPPDPGGKRLRRRDEAAIQRHRGQTPAVR